MTLDPDDALMAGYRRFRSAVWPAQAERYARLARRRQRPATAVIACSDARIDPQTIFDAEPGELFVIRNVAGLVPEYAPDGGCHGTSAALEYAVKILKVRRIVVLGHAQCDGIHAMIHGPLRSAPDFLAPWVDIAEPVMWPMPEQGSGETFEAAIEDAVLRQSQTNLRTFPWIREAEKSGQLALSAWKFSIATGELTTV
ncbi:carbonic anhydrase [Brevundimonas sp. UBA2416]|jgi:carbonic anhydrase|uniref:carbonic anhydrase n=2 Tax=Brevundimonas TaxID=41275 RepID=UPI001072BDC0|nr:carbonic anhydrase [Brevundimonas sp. UBA2416]QBX36767.1 carbonic anhydrase [Brevundimonas sp. MF30-B]TFW04438.1 carbonic anhydrase [Brevundimonas sp. S30B]